jgi:DnaJ-class molecular chaperone
MYLGTIKIPLECFLLGDSHSFEINVVDVCDSCFKDGEKWVPCQVCGQTGKNVIFSMFKGTTIKKCGQCQGEGWIRKKSCNKCRNSGKRFIKKNIVVKVPENYSLGNNTVVVKGGGEQGHNAPHGDLKVTLSPGINRLENLSEEEIESLRRLLNKGRR